MSDTAAGRSPAQARAQLREWPQVSTSDRTTTGADKITSWLSEVPNKNTEPTASQVHTDSSISPDRDPHKASLALPTKSVRQIMRPKILMRPATVAPASSPEVTNSLGEDVDNTEIVLSEFCLAKKETTPTSLAEQIRPLARSDMAMTIPQAKELRQAGRVADVPFCQYEKLLGVCEHRKKRCVWLHAEEWEECLLVDNFAEKSYLCGDATEEEGED